jgi:hypothetical protein
MQRKTRHASLLVKLTASAFCLSLFACAGATQIASPNGDGSKKRSKDAAGAFEDDDERYDDDGSLREDGIGTLASGDGSKPIAYPELDLRGAGSLSCDGERYDTVAGYRMKLSAEALNLDFYDGRVVNAGSRVESEANPQIAQKLGPTIYKRPNKDARATLIKGGFPWAPYVIYADSVVKQKDGVTFTFAKPLPIFPWPAKASRYDELASGPKSWSSLVTGGPDGSFNATLAVSLIGVNGDEVTMKFVLTIAEDMDRHVYESFPVPKEAVYTLNSKTLDVRRVSVVNWYRGDAQCEGRPEDITMNYNLCVKTVNGKTETFGCP